MNAPPPQDVYAKCLPGNRGYPLWLPEPSNTLPIEHQKDGLQIGDVGVVDSSGGFDVLFNICRPRYHELHKRLKIPDICEFQTPVDLDIDREVDVRADTGTDVISSGVNRSTDRYEFSPTAFQGAILVLADGAIRHDLRLEAKQRFREAAEDHAIHWYEIAKRRYGASIGGSSLYLITGFSKTRSWALASFHDTSQSNSRIWLDQQGGGDNNPNVKQRWKATSHVEGRTGPENEQYGSFNQTIYISGFKIAIRDDVLRWMSQPVVESFPAASDQSHGGSCGCADALKQMFAGDSRKSKYQHRAGGQGGGTADHVPRLSQPFHPSDTINRFLLDRDPKSLVAITHDEEWISMVESGKIEYEQLARGDHLEKILINDYLADSQVENSVVYLARGKSEHTITDEPKPDNFWYPTPSSHQSHVAITRIRAENLAAGLRRIPSGFSVLVEFNGNQRRTKNKPVRLDEGIIEWDDLILLPSESSMMVRLTVCASYEMFPMLGKGEVLYTSEKSMAEWRDDTHSILFSPEVAMGASCCSLLITVERQTLNYFLAVSSQNSHSDWEGFSDFAQATDLGHDALLQHRKEPRKKKLETSLGHFHSARERCPSEHQCRPAVLRNLAAAKFFRCQVTGETVDLEDSIKLYQEALDICTTGHPDRPATLLHLAHALVYRYGKHGYDESVLDDIKDLVAEIHEVCQGNTHERRAAELVLQTCKRHKVVSHGDLTKLDELLPELKEAVKVTAESYFDRPQRLYNLGVALRQRFEVSNKSNDLTDLFESIAANEEAVKLVLPGDPDRPEMLTTLGASLLKRFELVGNIVDIEKSISASKEAVGLTRENHLNRAELLTSYGIALLKRFEKASKPADINLSSSSLEEALRLTPADHPNRPHVYINLGNTSFSRFQRFGDPGDLDKSIFAVREALRLTPDIHLDPQTFAILGVLFLVRFQLLGEFDDLQRSIRIVWEVLLLVPTGDALRRRLLGILGTSYFIRYQRQREEDREISDIAKSISMIEQALRSIPDGDPIRRKILTIVSTSIVTGFDRLQKLSDVTKAINAVDPDRKPAATPAKIADDLCDVIDSLTVRKRRH